MWGQNMQTFSKYGNVEPMGTVMGKLCFGQRQLMESNMAPPSFGEAQNVSLKLVFKTFGGEF